MWPRRNKTVEEQPSVAPAPDVTLSFMAIASPSSTNEEAASERTASDVASPPYRRNEIARRGG